MPRRNFKNDRTAGVRVLFTFELYAGVGIVPFIPCAAVTGLCVFFVEPVLHQRVAYRRAEKVLCVNLELDSVAVYVEVLHRVYLHEEFRLAVLLDVE